MKDRADSRIQLIQEIKKHHSFVDAYLFLVAFKASGAFENHGVFWEASRQHVFFNTAGRISGAQKISQCPSQPRSSVSVSGDLVASNSSKQCDAIHLPLVSNS